MPSNVLFILSNTVSIKAAHIWLYTAFMLVPQKLDPAACKIAQS
jgi:hypothetical protein